MWGWEVTRRKNSAPAADYKKGPLRKKHKGNDQPAKLMVAVTGRGWVRETNEGEAVELEGKKMGGAWEKTTQP